jgi:sec-independent protein translocase protein TatB
MFGLGMGEILIILVLALVLLGPQRLPDAAKQLGKGLREFRKATEDLKQQFETELYTDERKAPRPKLVETPPTPDAAAAIPPGGVPAAAAGEVPRASAENVPGLDVALAEPVAPPPALQAAPAGAPVEPAAPPPAAPTPPAPPVRPA